MNGTRTTVPSGVWNGAVKVAMNSGCSTGLSPINPHAAGKGRMRQAVEPAYQLRPRRAVQLVERR